VGQMIDGTAGERVFTFPRDEAGADCGGDEGSFSQPYRRSATWLNRRRLCNRPFLYSVS